MPPVRMDSDGGHGNCVAEIQSRVLKGKGGGGGGGGGTSQWYFLPLFLEGCGVICPPPHTHTHTSLPPELEGDERLRNIEPRMVELIMNEVWMLASNVLCEVCCVRCGVCMVCCVRCAVCMV